MKVAAILTVCFVSCFAVPKPDVFQYWLHLPNGERVSLANLESKTGLFKPDSEIIILIHGSPGKEKRPWYVGINDAYLSRKDKVYQVIQPEWPENDSRFFFLFIVKYAREVGRIIGEFLLQLAEREDFYIERYHLLGYSLGSHIAGFIGKYIYEQTALKPGRITALDAYGPGFSDNDPKERLHKEDAEVVVAIHTDNFYSGLGKPYGDVDFYPNGGKHGQPGCKTGFWQFTEDDDAGPTTITSGSGLTPKNIVEKNFTIECSHRRSYEFWEEALLGYTFLGTKCDSWESYINGSCAANKKLNFGSGDTIKKSDFGSYYTVTNAVKPYILDNSVHQLISDKLAAEILKMKQSSDSYNVVEGNLPVNQGVNSILMKNLKKEPFHNSERKKQIQDILLGRIHEPEYQGLRGLSRKFQNKNRLKKKTVPEQMNETNVS